MQNIVLIFFENLTFAAVLVRFQVVWKKINEILFND